MVKSTVFVAALKATDRHFGLQRWGREGRGRGALNVALAAAGGRADPADAADVPRGSFQDTRGESISCQQPAQPFPASPRAAGRHHWRHRPLAHMGGFGALAASNSGSPATSSLKT